MDDKSTFSIDMAYKGIEEGIRALNGVNMALKSEIEALPREYQERERTSARNMSTSEALEAERQELVRILEDEFHAEQQLEAV